jgi:hypothetical protein
MIKTKQPQEADWLFDAINKFVTEDRQLNPLSLGTD